MQSFYGLPQTMSLVAMSGPSAGLSPTVLDLPDENNAIRFDFWGNQLDQPSGNGVVGMCLTLGASIRTPFGDRKIEDLNPGDIVFVWDGGSRPIRMIHKQALKISGRSRDYHLWLVTISADAMGFGLPRRDISVSAEQRMLYQYIRVPLMFGEDAVFVWGKSLVASFEHVTVKADPEEVCYYHLVFDQHEVIFAEGAATQSFMPTADSSAAVSAAEQDVLFHLFPALRFGGRSHDPALMTLRSW
jgi:hypothetical protein